MFTLAHVSDLHLPLQAAPRWRDLVGKRILGYLSYRLKRKMVHDRAVLAALVDDLRHHAPDHVAITGDLTNIALPEEFTHSAQWLCDSATRCDWTAVSRTHTTAGTGRAARRPRPGHRLPVG